MKTYKPKEIYFKAIDPKTGKCKPTASLNELSKEATKEVGDCVGKDVPHFIPVLSTDRQDRDGRYIFDGDICEYERNDKKHVGCVMYVDSNCLTCAGWRFQTSEGKVLNHFHPEHAKVLSHVLVNPDLEKLETVDDCLRDIKEGREVERIEVVVNGKTTKIDADTDIENLDLPDHVKNVLREGQEAMGKKYDCKNHDSDK